MKTTYSFSDDDFKEIAFKLAGGGGKKPPRPPYNMPKSHYEEYREVPSPEVEVVNEVPPTLNPFHIPFEADEYPELKYESQHSSQQAQEEFLQRPFIHTQNQEELPEEYFKPSKREIVDEEEDFIPTELQDPENVELLPQEQWLENINPDLIADEWHTLQLAFPSLPPFKPLTEEDQCLPIGDSKQMLNFFKQTRELSAVKVYFSNQEYKTNMQYNISHPNGFIRYLHIDFPMLSPYYLSLNMLANLDVHDGSNYIRWLGEKIFISHVQTERPPSVIYFSFQIKAKLVFEVPKAIKQLTVTSPVYCVETPKFQERFFNALISWIDDLKSKSGSDEYSRWFVDGYHAYHVTDMTVMHFTQFKAGGCTSQRIAQNLKEFLFCPQSRDNYCFFAVLLNDEYFQEKTEHLLDYTQKLEYLREHEAGLPLDLNPVFFKDLPEIARKLNIYLNVYTEKTTYGGKYKNSFELKEENKFNQSLPLIVNREINMLWIKRNGLGHFYGIRDMNLLEMVSCAICYNWFYQTSPLWLHHTEHCKRCDKCGMHAGSKHKCRQYRNRHSKKELKDKQKKKKFDWDKDVWFADFETYTKGDGTQHVYCSALMSIVYASKYEDLDCDILQNVFCERFWGDRSIQSFVEYILAVTKPMTIVFYNGCRFDYYFLVREFIRRKLEFTFSKDEKTSMISILRYKKIKFMDLYRFTGCSLMAACLAFKVPKKYCKTDFNHSKVVDMASANNHQNEIIEYCKYDVISLGILYYIIAKQFFNDWKVSLKEYISLPHLAYDIWPLSLQKEYTRALTLPTSTEYNFLRAALYGGRVYCGEPKYYPNLVGTALLLKYWPLIQDKWKDDIINHIKDSPHQLKLFDFTSLYPAASQMGISSDPDAIAYFPCGNYEWIDPNQFDQYSNIFNRIKSLNDQEIKLLRRCFFEVDIECPDDIDIPVLLGHRKVGKGYKMIANLLPKQNQYYSGYILLHCLFNYKYRITKIHRILKYGQLLPLLHDFMSKIMKKKDEADARGDEVSRNINKNMANGSTGKFSQCAFELEWNLWYQDIFLNFLNEDDLKEDKIVIETFFSQLEPIAYYVGTPLNDTDKYKKCPQIGVIILDIAKIKMDQIMASLELHSKNKLYYTDTDSIIIKKEVFDQHAKLPIWGPTYGLMKDEFPHVVFTEGIFWAPKTYAMLGIDLKEKKVVMYFKAKGAPQDKSLLRNKLYYINDLDQTRRESKHAENSLKYIMYHLVEDGHVLDESVYIPYDWLLKMFDKKSIKIVVRYGSFKKLLNFGDAEESAAHVRLLTKLERCINENYWWPLFPDEDDDKDYPRVFRDGRSYPVGHKKS